MILDRIAIHRASHRLYSLVFVEELQKAGGKLTSIGECKSYHEFVHEQTPSKQDPIIYTLVGRLWEAWGYDPGLVFHHMYDWLCKNGGSFLFDNGIKDEIDFQAWCLFKVLAQCMGNKVNLLDSRQMEQAWTQGVEHGLNRVSLKKISSGLPFSHDAQEWRELALERIDKKFGWDKAYATL